MNLWRNTKADVTGKSYSHSRKVKNLTKENNDNIILYAIWGEKYEYSIEKYSHDEQKNYIYKIPPDTEYTEYMNNIFIDNGYEMIVDKKDQNNQSLIYTGGKMKLLVDSQYGKELDKEYTNIVSGDVSGDGKANSLDLLMIKKHLLKTNILDEPFTISADINDDNNINSIDLLRLRQHLLGIHVIGG